MSRSEHRQEWGIDQESSAIVKRVPRNRPELPRDDKVDAILDGAESVLIASGYDGLSVAQLARDLHLAQNTVYWYFGDKDGLLVAVLERAAKRVLMKAAALERRGPIEQILAVVDQLPDLGPVIAAVRQRAPRSDPVRAFERSFDSSVRNLLRDALRPLVQPSELDEVADAFQLAAIGALAQPLPRAKRQRLLRRTLEALLA